MANLCEFEMQISGRREAVEEFVRMISYKGEFEKDGLGRVYKPIYPVSAGLEVISKDPEIVSTVIAGDCAWSLKSALCDSSPRNLYGETERLGIAVEAYSSEPGNRFQEHIVMCCGNMVENETVDYQEYVVDGANESELAEWAEFLGISAQELVAGANEDGEYTIGGFGDDFCCYEDPVPLLQDAWAEMLENDASDRQTTARPALDAKIQEANSRRSEPAVDGQEIEHVR